MMSFFWNDPYIEKPLLNIDWFHAHANDATDDRKNNLKTGISHSFS